MATDGLKTPRTTLKRRPQRGSHDWETLAAILDEAFVCHIGFEVDGQPYVVPTAFGRDGRTLYIHGSSASRMLRQLSDGVRICFTATLLDGIVLARSAFHHSMNYRSVMVLGTARPVEDESEKLRALEVISEQIIRGRWQDVRQPTRQEMKATAVLRLDVEEASAKVRAGGPIDDAGDMDLPVWAGILPLSLVAGEPEADPELRGEHPAPPYATGYTRPQK